jgi:hypothetical protein
LRLETLGSLVNAKMLLAYGAFPGGGKGALLYDPALRPVEAPHHAQRQYLFLLIDE